MGLGYGDPHAHRWMLFVDGENFAIRARQLAAKKRLEFASGKYHQPDVFLWFAERPAGEQTFVDSTTARPFSRLLPQAQRSFFYTSVRGDDKTVADTRRALWDIGFQPEVFRKVKDKSKGVDITLARDFLSHAFHGNYEAAVLVTGDGDYIPMVQEAKRHGRIVHVAFFADCGLNPDLKLAADSFTDIWPFLHDTWSRAGPDRLVQLSPRGGPADLVEMRAKVYVAGTHDGSHDSRGLEAAVSAAEGLADLGFAPFVPSLSFFWRSIRPQRAGKFFPVLARQFLTDCDAVFRAAGDSADADADVALAGRLGLPVFHSLEEIDSHFPRT